MKRSLLLCALAWACGAGEHTAGNGNPSPPDSTPGLDTAIHLEPVKEGGNAQTGVVGKEMVLPLIVRVMNRGVPIQGLFVEWHADFPGGSFNPVLAKSDLNGHAVSRYTTSTRAGRQSAHATLNGTTVYFLLDVVPDVPDEIQHVRGDGDSAVTYLSLGVRVLDKHGNAVPQVVVDWQILSGDVVFEYRGDSTGFTGESGSFLHFGSIKGPASVSVSVPGVTPFIFNVKSY